MKGRLCPSLAAEPCGSSVQKVGRVKMWYAVASTEHFISVHKDTTLYVWLHILLNKGQVLWSIYGKKRDIMAQVTLRCLFSTITPFSSPSPKRTIIQYFL